LKSERKKKFYTLRVVRPWQRLPREVVGAPSLETFQARLDGALSNLIWLKMSLLMAGGLDWMAFKGPFPPELFKGSMIRQMILPIQPSEATTPGKQRKPLPELVKLKLCSNFYVLLK